MARIDPVDYETAGGRTKALLDSDIDAAHRAGLTDAQLGDIVGHVAVNVLTNYFNRAFEVDVDFPVVHPHERRPAAETGEHRSCHQSPSALSYRSTSGSLARSAGTAAP